MTSIFRSTTALIAILSVAAPTFVGAQPFAAPPAPIRLAQGDAPVVVIPPGEAPKADAKAEQKKKADKKKAKDAKAAEAKPAAADEPVVVAPADTGDAAPQPRDKKANANAKAAKSDEPVVVAPVTAEDEAAVEVAKSKKAEAAKKKAEAAEAERAVAEQPVVVAPVTAEDKAAVEVAKRKKAEAAKKKAEAAEAERAVAEQPAVVAPATAEDKAAVEVAKRKKAEAAKKKAEAAEAERAAAEQPVVVAPVTAEDKAAAKVADSDKALAEALKAKQAQQDKPVVVPANGGKAKGDDKSRGGGDPVVVDDSSRIQAATGQSAAPQPVTPDAAALAAALAAAQGAKGNGKAKGNDNGKAPVVVAAPDEALPGEDAAAVAAAKGAPVVADALNAAADLGKDAKSVVVTEDSARSSSEDFGTSVASAAAAAAAAAAGKGPVVTDGRQQGSDGRPVVVFPGDDGYPTEARDNDDGNHDDNGDKIAKVLAAGLGAYVVGQMIQNRGVPQGRVALNTGDRVVVQAPDGSQQIWRDDDALLLRPGAEVTTENFADGSSRSIVTRADGSRVVTIRDAQLRVLRRTLLSPNGTATELINDAAEIQPVEVASLPPAARPLPVNAGVSTRDLRAALEQEASIDRRFSLGQIRNISQVRNLVAPISIDSITFDTGSAAIPPTQAQQLSTLGQTIAEMVKANPAEVFLIEGYTDTVGQPASNLALSDRRAESLALALSEYFGVPPENMVVQGYGETFLRVSAEGDVRENRRVAVRRITDLLQD